MAKTRLSPAKRKRIYIARKGDQGDIQISGGVARIRLTPKVIFLFVSFIALAVAIVFLAARQGPQTGAPAGQASSVPQTRQEPTRDSATGNKPPSVSLAEIAPPEPTAETVLNLKYGAIDPEGDAITYLFRWYVNDRLAQEGAESVLKPGLFRKGDVVRAEVAPADPYGNGETLSSSPVTIRNLRPVIASAAIDPQTPILGSSLTAVPSASDPDGDALTCSYQWLINNTPRGPSAAQNTFSTSGLSKRDSVAAAVVCSDGEASSDQVTTSSVVFGNSAPEITSSAPDSVVNGVYTYQVAARDPDGDKLEFRLERGPAGITIDRATGLIQWTVPKGAMYTGRQEIPVKFTVTDGDGGSVSQEFVIVLVDYVAY